MWLTGPRVMIDTDNAPEWLEDIVRDNLTGPMFRHIQQQVDLPVFQSIWSGQREPVDSLILRQCM